MLKKALTHIIILTLAVMPVQLISAGVENSTMQMSMQINIQMENECVHAATHVKSGVSEGQDKTVQSCCDDQSHQCQSCNNCPDAATSGMFLTSNQFVKSMPILLQSYFSNYSALSGIPQKSLLRPPRLNS